MLVQDRRRGHGSPSAVPARRGRPRPSAADRSPRVTGGPKLVRRCHHRRL